MKRIAITIASLAISTAALAGVSENYGSVLNDPVSASSGYDAPDTYLANHGSVLLDETTRNRGLPRTIERGLDQEISVGGADSIFESSSDDNF